MTLTWLGHVRLVDIFGTIEVLAMPFMAFVALAVTQDWCKARIEGRAIQWQAMTAAGLTMGLITFLLGAAAVVVALFAAPAVGWLGRSSAGHHVVLTSCAIALALALFALRKLQRVFYGSLEVVVSVGGMAAYPTAPVSAPNVLSLETTAWALGLMSLVYITIRGLDNVDVGLAVSRERRLKQATA